mmetsp:Transcript_24982/g.65117  ORF Transcript_24982/g.65117 Transcript_24982/m.65117 type:complete len:200 (+) Transcript_24982:201-800(+)
MLEPPPPSPVQHGNWTLTPYNVASAPASLACSTVSTTVDSADAPSAATARHRALRCTGTLSPSGCARAATLSWRTQRHRREQSRNADQISPSRRASSPRSHRRARRRPRPRPTQTKDTARSGRARVAPVLSPLAPPGRPMGSRTPWRLWTRATALRTPACSRISCRTASLRRRRTPRSSGGASSLHWWWRRCRWSQSGR